MIARLWMFSLVVTLAALAMAGCRRKAHETVRVLKEGADIFTTDDFPGAPVQNGNTADDRRAMSPSNEDVTGTVKVTYNGDRGTAMVSYTTFVGLSTILYTQYYDGETWTPPVAMEANGINAGSSMVDARSVIHAFVNTQDHDSAEARERDGDCVILWAARDVGTDGGPFDGVNRCLFSTYFDADLAHSPANRHGFQALADRLNLEDGAGEDVLAFGVATDGLRGEARWDTLGSIYLYGESTTSISAFWIQSENNDGDGVNNDQALHITGFDPAEVLDPEIPLTPSGDGRVSLLSFGASDSGTSSEETLVDTLILSSYNGTIVVRTAARNDTVGDDVPGFVLYGTSVDNDTDEALQAVTVNLSTGVPQPAVHLHSTVPLATDALDNRAFILAGTGSLASRCIFGSDEGLSNLAIFSTQTIDSLTGSYADIAANARLSIAELDEELGTVLSIGLIDVNDPDIADTVSPLFTDLRISRNGDYIILAWIEVVDSGGSDEIGLWAAQYLTTRRDDSGDPVPLPPLSDTMSPPVNVNPDVDGQGIAHFMFQRELGYVCGKQSNPDVMNLLYDQSAAANDNLNVVRLTADLVMPVVLGSTTTPLETFEEGDLSAAAMINATGIDFSAVDGGEDGNLFVVYRQDIDATATDDFRLFAEVTGTAPAKIEIDSSTTTRQVPSGAIHLFALPPGSDIGRFDPASGDDDGERAHAAEFVQVLFYEDAVDETDGLADALRTRQYTTDLGESTFGERFVPPVNASALEPFEMSLPFTNPDPAIGPMLQGQGVSGNRLGIWFSENGHLYYQECEAQDGVLGWRLADDSDDDSEYGVSDPALVDDDSEEDVFSVKVFASRTCTCDTLPGALILWTKQLPVAGAEERLQVRVRADLE